jgi:hypothetical protein
MGIGMVSKESLITGALIVVVTYTLGLSLVSQVSTATQVNTTLSSIGSIQIQTTAGIGVYSDYQCNDPLSSLSWGTLEPGESKTVICYIKNEGNTESTFTMYSSNWLPSSAQNYLTLSWNYNGQPIAPDSAVQVGFTLSVNQNIEGITNFSFDVTIVGTA